MQTETAESRPDYRAIAEMHLESINYLIEQNEELLNWVKGLGAVIFFLVVAVALLMMEIEKLIELI